MSPEDIELLQIDNEMFYSVFLQMTSEIKTLKIKNKHFSRIIKKYNLKQKKQK